MNLSSSRVKILIVVLSIVVPVLVVILYLLPKNFEVGEEVYYLPLLNAFINGTASLTLIAAFFAIKQKIITLHKNLMSYHALTESTPYGGEGAMKIIYLSILLTHILLAIAFVPLVLITFNKALSQKIDQHKKIARITLPLWLYVTVTGVIVYIMISPYY